MTVTANLTVPYKQKTLKLTEASSLTSSTSIVRLTTATKPSLSSACIENEMVGSVSWLKDA